MQFIRFHSSHVCFLILHHAEKAIPFQIGFMLIAFWTTSSRIKRRAIVFGEKAVCWSLVPQENRQIARKKYLKEASTCQLNNYECTISSLNLDTLINKKKPLLTKPYKRRKINWPLLNSCCQVFEVNSFASHGFFEGNSNICVKAESSFSRWFSVALLSKKSGALLS